MFNVCWQLALKDLWHDRNVSLCIIAALVAVIAPLLLLFGLKHGVITQLQHDLTQKPDLLEIKTQGNTHRLDLSWIQSVQEREDVSFAIGLTRSLNTEAQVFKTEQAAKNNFKDHLYSEIIPTQPGDPLLRKHLASIDAEHVAISYALAQKLNAKIGDPLFFRLARTSNGIKKFVYIQSTIDYILEPKDYPRPATFVPMGFLLGIEYFIDGIHDDFIVVDPVPTQHQFANVRIYANNMSDVLQLSEWLEQQHINTHSQQSAIQSMLTINQVLSLIFTVIAGTALVGGCISLTGSFLANIDRKRQLISTLRLLGFNKKNIVSYITIQVFFITTFSFISALVFYFLGSSIFNTALGTHNQTAAFSTYLNYQQLGLAFAITSLLSFIVALIGAIQSMRIEPAESLREL